jgi:hypothetical protein
MSDLFGKYRPIIEIGEKEISTPKPIPFDQLLMDFIGPPYKTYDLEQLIEISKKAIENVLNNDIPQLADRTLCLSSASNAFFYREFLDKDDTDFVSHPKEILLAQAAISGLLWNQYQDSAMSPIGDILGNLIGHLCFIDSFLSSKDKLPRGGLRRISEENAESLHQHLTHKGYTFKERQALFYNLDYRIDPDFLVEYEDRPRYAKFNGIVEAWDAIEAFHNKDDKSMVENLERLRCKSIDEHDLLLAVMSSKIFQEKENFPLTFKVLFDLYSSMGVSVPE